MSLQFREVFRVAPQFVSLEKFVSSDPLNPRQLVSTLKPSSAVFSPGITETVKQTANNLGIIGEVLRFPSSEIPAITLQFPGVDINVMEYKLGREFEVANATTIFAGSDFLDRTNIIPGAADSTQQGFGILADTTTAIASVFRDNFSVQLTRVPFAGFTGATPDQFAIGANGARSYSTNLLTQKATVNFSIGLPLTNVARLSTTILSPLSLAIGLITVNGQVATFRAPSVQPILEGDVDFSADSVPVQFRINSSGCTSYDIVFTDQVVFCA
jgi:hypothetical protein